MLFTALLRIDFTILFAVRRSHFLLHFLDSSEKSAVSLKFAPLKFIFIFKFSFNILSLTLIFNSFTVMCHVYFFLFILLCIQRATLICDFSSTLGDILAIIFLNIASLSFFLPSPLGTFSDFLPLTFRHTWMDPWKPI